MIIKYLNFIYYQIILYKIMTFNNSITKHRSIYFHFLDGLLNNKAGGSFKNVLLTLKELNIDFNEIKFINIIHTGEQTKIEVINPSDTVQKNFIEFNYFDTIKNFKEIINFIKENFKFCIISNEFNEHYTTTIIFIKNYKLYLFILNTGLDIEENGKNIKLDDQILDQLTKGIIICNNINNDADLIESFKIFKNYIFINFFYDYINKKKYKHKSSIINTSYEFNENFRYYIDIFNLNFYGTYTDFIFKLNDNKINIIQLIEHKNDIFNNYSLIIIINYYKLISKFIDIHHKEVIGNIVKIDQYNNLIINELNEEFSESFKKKIIIYNNNNNLYINCQESGSCTWYCTYFSMLLYYIIHDNKTNYIKFIKNINTKFYEYLKSIYNKDNFTKELLGYTSQPEYIYSNYLYMKKLCSKLIDIKLINNDILYDEQDFIYNVNFKIKNFIDIDKDIDIKSDDNYYNSSMNCFDFCQKLQNDKIFDLDINNYLLYLTAYDIFIQERYQVFKKQINSSKILDNLYLFIKDKKINSFFEKSITNDINLFVKIDTLCLKENIPSYITYFIPIIFYINSIKKKKILDFNDNINDLFKCSLIFHKFIIFLRIINSCNNLVEYKDGLDIVKYSSKDIEKLFDIIIKELISINETDTFINSKININLKKPKKLRFINDINILGIFDYNLDLYNYKEFDNIILESFDIKFNNYENMEAYLYDNPYNINPLFIYFNFERINNNLKIKKKLIKFFSEKVYENKYNKNEKFWHSLYSLIYNLPYENNNLFLIKYQEESMNYFINIIEKKKSMNSKNDFVTDIVKNYHIIFINIFKIIPEYNETSKTIESIIYKQKKCNNDFFIKLFESNINLNSFLFPENLKDNFDFYQILNDNKNYLKYECEKIKYSSYDDDEFKINKIYFNGNRVLKFNEINYPFKYLIPITDLYFIYKKNDVYNITFKNSNYENEDEDSILGKNCLKTGFYNFEINPNTQFFLNKFSSDSKLNFESWNSLCCDLQVNSYNIMYVNYKNIDVNTTGYSCNYKRFPDIYNFDKSKIFKEHIEYNHNDFKLLENEINNDYLVNFNINNKECLPLTESYKKLLFKISECKIVGEKKKYKWINKLNIIKLFLESKIIKFTNYIKDTTLGYLLNNYSILQSYLLNIKIYNFIDKLLFNINDQIVLCSIIKNYNFLFDFKKNSYFYKFQILFELINGNEILKEQMERYVIMINSFNRYNAINRSKQHILLGGTIEDELTENLDSLIDVKLDLQFGDENFISCDDNYYQLHHFMMGKGKSAIITPLLSIHLNIIYDQKIYLIVPKHLVKQTEETLNDYINIFLIENIFIKSEDQIKKDFLDDKIIKDNTVFLIDEFDSLINPLKSNFNYVKNSKLNIDDISNVIRNIIEENKDNLKSLNKDTILEKIKNINIIRSDLFADNIIIIINQLNNNTLKYNIKWGIDTKELHAIPYRSKDKPIENSSFISCIMTIFLTYYYYIIIQKYQIDDNILKYIIENTYLKKLLKINDLELNVEKVNQTLEIKEIKTEFYNYLFIQIFSKIKLPEEHYNTSFIDIINIDNVFKIGYSGTININLPKLKNYYKFDQKCKYLDEDEKNNIEYAIINSTIYKFCIEQYLDNLNDFDALIDICGYFYNYSNYSLALELHKKLNKNIIFINENDEKFIIKKGGILEKLNENIVYDNPFFYFDQSHIVGIDIKQDNYPILHGLCMVDNLSYYSEVAQAMFRLRKLNLGHRISFVLNNFIIKDTKLLLQKFRDNEKNLIEQQQNNLNLQALKSDIRKKRTNYNFIDRYKEKLFYYFRNDLPINQLELIFSKEEIKTINLKDYDLTIEKVNKIIFNLDFESNEIKNQIISQEKIQTQTQTQIQTQIQTQTKSNLQLILNDNLLYFEKYKFKNFDFMKMIDNQKKFNLYTIKLNDILSFLPNIFINNYDSLLWSTLSSNYDILNNSDIVFVYIHYVEKFILIPKYMVIHLYYDFLMYDLNFNIINNSLRKYRVYKLEQKLENDLFSKIITNNYKISDFIEFVQNNNNSLCLLILYYRIKIGKLNNPIFLELYEKKINIIKDYIICNLDTQKQLFNEYPKDINTLLRKSTLKIPRNSFKYKYLKYKQKYLNLLKIYTVK